MKVTEPEHAQHLAELFDATIAQAVAGARPLMARLVAHVRACLRAQEDEARDRRERDRLTYARRLLNQLETALCERFAEELRNAFNRLSSLERPSAAAPESLRFDRVGALDDAQLHEQLAQARARHSVQAAADAALAELNRLICALRGFQEVRLERNPLRPSVYADAVIATLSHVPVPGASRQAWISLMCGALGHELDIYYRDLCADLRDRGVGAADGDAAAAVQDPPSPDSGLLTLEKLRRLLAEAPPADPAGLAFDPAPAASSGDGQSVLAPAQPETTAFSATVPAAFEAARDMRQLRQVAQRLQARGTAAAVQGTDARDRLRSAARGVEQQLGLEVVALMVDNITRDPRLLAPVQQLVAALEPALLQLALVDPRFFTHKQHPARRLLHEITHRSIAYESVDSRGFSGFMEPLQEAVAPLAAQPIDTAEPFDRALARLVASWDGPGEAERRRLERAVLALREAEQRNALAATIVADLHGRADLAGLSPVVFDFLCGPWAQVVAQARIRDRTGAVDPGAYAQAIEDLIWSAQPALASRNRPALARLVPDLLERLHAGLASIELPPAGSAEFFRALEALHRAAQDPAAQSAASAEPRSTAPAPVAPESVWLAPTEVQVSGFIDLEPAARGPALAPVPAELLQTGLWVMLLAEDGWTRTQLIWTSPSATLLLFSDALGYMQSLTRKACEQMFAQGQMRILSQDPVADALDAVAQTAIRNSVDIRV